MSDQDTKNQLKTIYHQPKFIYAHNLKNEKILNFLHKSQEEMKSLFSYLNWKEGDIISLRISIIYEVFDMDHETIITLPARIISKKLTPGAMLYRYTVQLLTTMFSAPDDGWFHSFRSLIDDFKQFGETPEYIQGTNLSKITNKEISDLEIISNGIFQYPSGGNMKTISGDVLLFNNMACCKSFHGCIFIDAEKILPTVVNPEMNSLTTPISQKLTAGKLLHYYWFEVQKLSLHFPRKEKPLSKFNHSNNWNCYYEGFTSNQIESYYSYEMNNVFPRKYGWYFNIHAYEGGPDFEELPIFLCTPSCKRITRYMEKTVQFDESGEPIPPKFDDIAIFGQLGGAEKKTEIYNESTGETETHRNIKFQINRFWKISPPFVHLIKNVLQYNRWLSIPEEIRLPGKKKFHPKRYNGPFVGKCKRTIDLIRLASVVHLPINDIDVKLFSHPDFLKELMWWKREGTNYTHPIVLVN